MARTKNAENDQQKPKLKGAITKKKPTKSKKETQAVCTFNVLSDLQELPEIKSTIDKKNLHKLSVQYSGTPYSAKKKNKSDKSQYLKNILEHNTFNPSMKNRWKNIIKVEGNTRTATLSVMPKLCEIILYTGCFNVIRDLVVGSNTSKVYIQKQDVDFLFNEVYKLRYLSTTLIPTVKHPKKKHDKKTENEGTEKSTKKKE